MKYRLSWAAAVAGLAIHFLGLGWDVYRHSSDSSLAQREDVLSLTNPSHLLVVAGMAIVAAALLGMASVWMHDRSFGGRGRAGVLLRGVSLPAIAVVAAGSIWLASSAEDDSDHDDSAAHAAADHHEGSGPGTQDAAPILAIRTAPGSSDGSHAHDAATGSQEAMGEANAHTHGVEVAATAEQMLAAGQFAAAVKEKTAKYTDVRVALGDGYVQITQDLPGIAAHFIRLDYQRDGHEMDPDRPEVLLYTKRLDGNWRFIGAMFMAEQVSDTPPSYFGALDVWHRHENLCFTAGSQVRATASAAECKNGLFVNSTAYQMHVWTEPGAAGAFSHDFAAIAPGPFPGASQPAASELRAQAR